MKLLLTSDGITTSAIAEAALSLLPQGPSAMSALMVSQDALPQHAQYIEAAKSQVTDLGIEDITFIDLSQESLVLPKRSFDLLYICGGNTFRILDRMRTLGVDLFLIDAVQNGAVYLGVSAGSIIAGPDIAISSWGSEGDVNDIDLEDLTGFGLVELVVFRIFARSCARSLKRFNVKRRAGWLS